MKKLSLSLAVFLFGCVFIYAQDKKESEPNKNWEIGGRRWWLEDLWHGCRDIGIGLGKCI